MASRIVTCVAHKARRRTRDPQVVRRYWSIWEGLPCEWGLLIGEHCRGEELNHILSGSSKEDAAWNFAIMCVFHHRDNVHGFHGSEGRDMRERLLQDKLDRGFTLPREAYRYLECGIDAAPDVEVDEDENFRLVEERADNLRGEQWLM
jgi:hypothetical protein